MGRKRQVGPAGIPLKKVQKVHMTFPVEELAAVDDWGFAQRIRERTAVVRLLVRKGLEAEAARQGRR